VTHFDPAVIPNDDWETLISAGMALAQDMDARRFELGDVGALVETRYGQNSLGKFASEIGMAQKKTLREYVRVARHYPPATRVVFLESGLNWSHFRAALRAKDDAETWLGRAADEGWPVAELARQISASIGAPVAPRLLYDGKGYASDNGLLVVMNLLGDTTQLTCETVYYQVKVYEAEVGP
jgi:hypothetical protein